MGVLVRGFSGERAGGGSPNVKIFQGGSGHPFSDASLNLPFEEGTISLLGLMAFG